MGLFCLECNFIWGHGPGVPDLIHEKSCSSYDEAYYKKHYPELDVERAQSCTRMYGKNDYALKMHTLSPAYKKKQKRRERNKLKWQARHGDLKAKRRLRPNPSRMFRMVACKMRRRTREYEWLEAERRIGEAWYAKKITTEQYRSEKKKVLEVFRSGASREELRALYQDL